MIATPATTVLIVEDEPVTRRGLQLFMQRLPAIRVIDIVDNGECALSKSLELHPDIILMDIGLPGMDGISAAKEIKKQDPNRRVLMLTADNSDESIFASFGAGADGYVLKSSFAHSLELAIRTVRAGSVWLDPQIAQTILKLAVGSPGASSLAANVALSRQEKQVLNQLANTSCEDGVCFVQPGFVAELKRFRDARSAGN